MEGSWQGGRSMEVRWDYSTTFMITETVVPVDPVSGKQGDVHQLGSALSTGHYWL